MVFKALKEGKAWSLVMLLGGWGLLECLQQPSEGLLAEEKLEAAGMLAAAEERRERKNMEEHDLRLKLPAIKVEDKRKTLRLESYGVYSLEGRKILELCLVRLYGEDDGLQG
ncbi:hypothetical protein L3X38_027478 [Prunus dulcis]|uniref:Uncharacterized protein n=1 Tax=Prunus dulcis TaxID=3755 RepID=A0AAD4VQM2_PRUDU|nr:hypothetical protein L3X38_027478 [Prunus dulcis]